MEDRFEPVDATMLAFVDAVIAYAPVRLAPLRMQLAHARASNVGNGWIDVIDVVDGVPVDWTPYNPVYDLFPDGFQLPKYGPQQCLFVGLKFHCDGRLCSFEFWYYDEESGGVDVPALTRWLDAVRPPADVIAVCETQRASELAARRREWAAEASHGTSGDEHAEDGSA